VVCVVCADFPLPVPLPFPLGFGFLTGLGFAPASCCSPDANAAATAGANGNVVVVVVVVVVGVAFIVVAVPNGFPFRDMGGSALLMAANTSGNDCDGASVVIGAVNADGMGLNEGKGLAVAGVAGREGNILEAAIVGLGFFAKG